MTSIKRVIHEVSAAAAGCALAHFLLVLFDALKALNWNGF